MEEGYFVKINESTGIQDVLSSIQNQEALSRKKVRFNKIKNIVLSDCEFCRLLNPIAQSNPLYGEYGTRSNLDSDGALQCISITNASTNSQLIAYTGGRTFPLYISYKASD